MRKECGRGPIFWPFALAQELVWYFPVPQTYLSRRAEVRSPLRYLRVKTASPQGWPGLCRPHHRAANLASSPSDPLLAALVPAAPVEGLGRAVSFGCILVVLVAVPGHRSSTWAAASTEEPLEEVEKLEGQAKRRERDNHFS